MAKEMPELVGKIAADMGKYSSMPIIKAVDIGEECPGATTPRTRIIYMMHPEEGLVVGVCNFLHFVIGKRPLDIYEQYEHVSEILSQARNLGISPYKLLELIKEHAPK